LYFPIANEPTRDAVLNHKAAADHREKCIAQEVDPNDRNRRITDPYEIDAWLGFDFLGRGDKYSSQKYHWYHFSGTDFNAANNKTAIYEIVGDRGLGGWAKSGDVDDERGNYDYLMFADLEYSHPEVQQDVLNWGKFLANEIPIQGIRFDAIKHFSEDFLRTFVAQMDEVYNEGWFFVGEFWKDELGDMSRYLERMGMLPSDNFAIKY
jgi:alpha-amylase